jgi:SAM-dependent methyltransferase
MRVVEPQRSDAEEAAYAERLERLSAARWKRWLDVQAPYRWHLRRLRLGRVLDVGCGIGRNLLHLRDRGVGVDPNPHAVLRAQQRGLTAYTPERLAVAPEAAPGSFDALLLSHVLEHMSFAEAVDLVRRYLPYLRPGGRTVLITPQEAGFASDPTHVAFHDFAALAALERELGLRAERAYSFPFPRPAGRLFRYNEFVSLARRPD